MSPEMIAAIGSLVVGIGAILSAILLNRKTMALLEYRMGKVEKKLDSHNGYAKLFSETSSEISEMRTDIQVIKNDLSWIRKEVDDGK